MKNNKSLRRILNILTTHKTNLLITLLFTFTIITLYYYTTLNIPFLRPSKTSIFQFNSNFSLSSMNWTSFTYNSNITNEETTPEPAPKKETIQFKFRERACIIYLIKQSEEENFRKSIQTVYKYFNKQFRYPLIIFYDQFYPLKDMVNLIQDLRKYDPPIKFEFIEFKFPAHYDINKDPPKVWASNTLGYQIMIRFWFKEIFYLPIMQNYRYFMRFDTDSFIHTPINFDPFVVMKENGYTYGYRTIFKDEAYVTVGMYDFLEAYERTHTTKAKSNRLDIPPPGDRRNRGTPMMYNNFEIVDMKRFRQNDIKDFVDAVDLTNMIMTHRWGDAPLRYFEVMMCLDWNREVWNFCNFTYEHSHHNYIAKKCLRNHVG